jgi:imidazolonepropionase-like amidohydrolase
MKALVAMSLLFTAASAASEMNPRPSDPDLCTPAWLQPRIALDPGTEEELIADLENNSAKVRADAAERLGSGAAPRSVDRLLAALGDSDAIVRQLAARALGRIGDVRAEEKLGQALLSPDKNVRTDAAWALGRAGGALSERRLRDALRDDAPHVRMAAACSLGKIGTASAIADLETAAADSDALAAAAARWARTRTRSRSSSRIVIEQVALIDGTGAPPEKNVTVVIEGERIAAIERGNVSTRENARIIAGEGLWAIPGLWDLHIHAAHIGASSLGLFIANGVTSARDMAGSLDEVGDLRRRIESGRLVGPRLKVSGPALEGGKSAASRLAQERPESASAHVLVRSPEEARRVVGEMADRGADFIKIRTFEDRETYAAILDAASSRNLRVAGHAPWSLSPADALVARQQTFEHGFYPYPLADLDEDDRAKVIERFLAQRVALVPTLVAWQPRLWPYPLAEAITDDACGAIDYRRRFTSPRLLRSWRDGLADRREERREGLEGWRQVMRNMSADVGTLFRAGVTVLPGTDSGAPLVFPGFALADELEHLVTDVGMTPMEALVAATSRAAALFGEGGTARAGARADLVLLRADPSERISNVRLIEAVIANGRLFTREDIAALYASARQDTECSSIRDCGGRTGQQPAHHPLQSGCPPEDERPGRVVYFRSRGRTGFDGNNDPERRRPSVLPARKSGGKSQLPTITWLWLPN